MTARSALHSAKLIARHGPLYPLRSRVFPRQILRAAPIRTESSGTVTVCALTSSRDWLACLWSLVSFYVLSGRRDPVLIYSDGTLTDGQVEAMRRVFPCARFTDWRATDPAMQSRLASYPNCLRYRRSHPCARRVIDLASISDSRFVLVLDSDVLFFRPPRELVFHMEAPIENHIVFQRDMQDAYSIPRSEIARIFGVDAPARCNCGVMLADLADFPYALLENWLARQDIFTGDWADQTLWAMYAGTRSASCLGDDDAIRCAPGIPIGAVLKHYVKPIRDLLYVEGIPRIARTLRELDALRP